MATGNHVGDGALNKEYNNGPAGATTDAAHHEGLNHGGHHDHEHLTKHMTHDEHEAAKAAARFGYGPLSHVGGGAGRHQAFGGELAPGLFKSVTERKFANPAPLGLCAFALTTFVLSLINMNTRNLSPNANLVVAIAYGYGGLVQLLAGMWEMAVGNTFGATALGSYGGFWISFAIIFTPGGFDIQSVLEGQGAAVFYDSFGLYLMGWFIFTFLLLLACLRSTVAFFCLFFFLDLTFLLLGIGYLNRDAMGMPNEPVIKAGGFFGLLSAFAAWYNALAGMLDDSNSFFLMPVIHFPWSAKALERKKSEKATV